MVNPIMYQSLYPEDVEGGDATDMSEKEQVVPKTEEDVNRLMADLAAMGIQP